MPESTTLPAPVVRRKVVVTNPHGLHARPATRLAELICSSRSEVRISFDDKSADVRSVIALLLLRANHHALLTVVAQGEDASFVMARIQELFSTGFGECSGKQHRVS